MLIIIVLAMNRTLIWINQPITETAAYRGVSKTICFKFLIYNWAKEIIIQIMLQITTSRQSHHYTLYMIWYRRRSKLKVNGKLNELLFDKLFDMFLIKFFKISDQASTLSKVCMSVITRSSLPPLTLRALFSFRCAKTKISELDQSWIKSQIKYTKYLNYTRKCKRIVLFIRSLNQDTDLSSPKMLLIISRVWWTASFEYTKRVQ